MRLNAFIASSGLASRRGADQLIKSGLVLVNGRPGSLNDQINDGDKVQVRGKQINTQRPRYILLYKPAGVITSLSDPEGRKKITDLVKVDQRIVPVGRLDYHTRGAILLTNDGQLAQRLMHPSFGVAKVYQLTTKSGISDSVIEQFKKGVMLEDGLSKAADIKRLSGSAVEITLHQGRNRQIRRMVEAVGLKLVDLVRTQYGPLTLNDMPEGSWRELSGQEVELLRNQGIGGTITSNGITKKG
jgi:23S rRNA pseudouridine2605 synthase